MIGTAFAFVILPALGFGLLFGGIFYFIPYVVQSSGITLIYILGAIVIVEIPVYIYMKFIRKETQPIEDVKKEYGEFTFVGSYYPFLAHAFVIMYLISFVTDPLVKHLDIIGYPFLFVTIALAYAPVLMALYSVYFYWESITGFAW